MENKDGAKRIKVIRNLLFGSAVVSILIGCPYHVVKSRANNKVKDVSVLQIMQACDNCDDNRRDIFLEEFSELNRLEKYLNISNSINSLYLEYKDIIVDLDIDDISLLENGFIELEDYELEELSLMIQQVLSDKCSLSYDEKISMVIDILEYAPYVNGFLYFKGYDIIYNYLEKSVIDDVALAYGVDTSNISGSYNYEDKDFNISRMFLEEEYGYNISTSGVICNDICNDLWDINNDIVSINSFLNKEISTIYGGRNNGKSDSILITWDADMAKMYVYYDSYVNFKLQEYLNTILSLTIRDVSVNDNNFKYTFDIDEDMVYEIESMKKRTLCK